MSTSYWIRLLLLSFGYRPWSMIVRGFMGRTDELLSNFRRSVGWSLTTQDLRGDSSESKSSPPTPFLSSAGSATDDMKTMMLSSLSSTASSSSAFTGGSNYLDLSTSSSSKEDDSPPPPLHDEDITITTEGEQAAAAAAEVCPFFLMGKCRYKAKCKLRHSIDNCPHCGAPMPQGKIAGSTHLSRCYKQTKPAATKQSSD
eukprot:TRINITY_DN5752_c0_g1_i1.p1 TRINITY_DN5752_c0_g1~~TRINITY_DN5752_c0_g1_i1.p1  ORF type:complete len:200 (-),score=39.04 TRINITY_DN5752_c0_g1_i1:87-686(-)